jgi:hypothetical protein
MICKTSEQSRPSSRIRSKASNSRRNQFRGPQFVWSDMYLTKRIALREKLAMRLGAQFFNVFNHPNFGLPSLVLAGVPGTPRHKQDLEPSPIRHLRRLACSAWAWVAIAARA